MTEYIDREALITEIQNNINTYWNGGSGGYYLAEDALNYSVKTAPTADAVPKSEYDAVVIAVDNSTKEFLKLHDDYQEAKREVEELSGKYDDLKLKYADSLKDKDELIAWGGHMKSAEKAEVAREIFAEIEKSVASKIPMKIRPIFKDDRDFDAGVVDGKRDAFIEVLVLLAELKKKYTEEKHEN